MKSISFILFMTMISTMCSATDAPKSSLVASARVVAINGRKTLCIEIMNESPQEIRFSASDVSYASGSFAASYVKPWGRGNLVRRNIENSPTPIDIVIASKETKVFQFTLDLLFDLPKPEELRNVVVFYYFDISVLGSNEPDLTPSGSFPIGGFCKLD